MEIALAGLQSFAAAMEAETTRINAEAEIDGATNDDNSVDSGADKAGGLAAAAAKSRR